MVRKAAQNEAVLSVDVLSRKCHLRILKGKTSATVAAALLSIFNEDGVVPPAYVVTDRSPLPHHCAVR